MALRVLLLILFSFFFSFSISSQANAKRVAPSRVPFWSEFQTLNESQILQLSKSLSLGSLDFGSHITGSSALDRRIVGISDADLWLGDQKQVQEIKTFYQTSELLKFLDQMIQFEPEFVFTIPKFNLDKYENRLIHPAIAVLIKKAQTRLRIEKTLSGNSIQAMRNIARVARLQADSQIKRAQSLELDLSKRLLVINVAAELEKSNPTARSLSSFSTDDKQEFGRQFLQFLETDSPAVREITAAWVDRLDFDPEPQLDFVKETVRLALTQHYTVYVHGQFGISRSALVVLDFLLHHGDYTELMKSKPYLLYDSVFDDVVRKRPVAIPNYSFSRLLEFREEEILSKARSMKK